MSWWKVGKRFSEIRIQADGGEKMELELRWCPHSLNFSEGSTQGRQRLRSRTACFLLRTVTDRKRISPWQTAWIGERERLCLLRLKFWRGVQRAWPSHVDDPKNLPQIWPIREFSGNRGVVPRLFYKAPVRMFPMAAAACFWDFLVTWVKVLSVNPASLCPSIPDRCVGSMPFWNASVEMYRRSWNRM